MGKKNKKSIAKAVGVKSAFTVGDEVIITSFGKGNSAVLEKKIKGVSVENIGETFSLDSENITEEIYPIDLKKSRRVKIPKGGKTSEIFRPGMPDAVQSGVSVPGYRQAVEKFFFNTESGFDDNFHVQLAHSLMDIEKLLTVYLNNIIYTLNTKTTDSAGKGKDIIGMSFFNNTTYRKFVAALKKMSTDTEMSNTDKRMSDVAKLLLSINGDSAYDDKGGLQATLNPRLGYLGGAIIPNSPKYDTEKYLEYGFYRVLAIALARHSLAHSASENEKPFLYNIANASDIGIAEADGIADMLTNLYNGAIEKLNKDFIKNSRKNLSIIFNLLYADDDDKKLRIIREYYGFIVRKDNKNMGFSLKRLRELVLERFNGSDSEQGFDNKRYDPHRSKIYRILDFIFYDYYLKGEGARRSDIKSQDSIQGMLRACMSEEEKEAIYKAEADILYGRFNRTLSYFLRKCNAFLQDKKTDSYLKNDDIIDKIDKIGSHRNMSESWLYFCEFIYMATLFLDGKEINELITGLIHGFENIASMTEVMDSQQIAPDFRDAYLMFADSRKIAGELRRMLSFARMENKDSANIKYAVYVDALTVLGCADPERAAKLFFEDESGEGIGKGKHHKRNFIINNVIDSSRFRYLMRYSSADEIANVRANANLLKFVLGRMDDKILIRYAKLLSCNCDTGKDGNLINRRYVIDRLAEMLCEMSYESIISDISDTAPKGKDGKEETKKAMLSLYFIVLYHLIKNLVNVNARYFMAFHALERDLGFYGKMMYEGKIADYCALTDMAIEQYRRSPVAEGVDYYRLSNREKRALMKHKNDNRVADYLEVDVKALDDAVRASFRDTVAHLGVVRGISAYVDDDMNSLEIKSYFGIYHYCIQKYLLRGGFSGRLRGAEKVRELAERKNGRAMYSPDLVKALNAQFGYNLPRFKNLSVEGLFDMNAKPSEN